MVIFVHRPEYYHIYQGANGEDYRGKAEIIIAKHRKGATDIVLLNFRGEYTRFENPEDSLLGNQPPIYGGEIIGASYNKEYNPFDVPPTKSPF
jgi:replicative DNA helicase